MRTVAARLRGWTWRRLRRTSGVWRSALASSRRTSTPWSPVRSGGYLPEPVPDAERRARNGYFAVYQDSTRVEVGGDLAGLRQSLIHCNRLLAIRAGEDDH